MKGIIMKVTTVFLVALSGLLGAMAAAQAADSCSKDCREYQRVCVKAHSQSACKSEYDICMKHCKQK
jgi:hypothetical protein